MINILFFFLLRYFPPRPWLSLDVLGMGMDEIVHTDDVLRNISCFIADDCTDDRVCSA